jgi:hypothetical protein
MADEHSVLFVCVHNAGRVRALITELLPTTTTTT